jgi:hypothetical protein
MLQPFRYKTNSYLRNQLVLYAILHTHSNTPTIPEIYLVPQSTTPKKYMNIIPYFYISGIK